MPLVTDEQKEKQIGQFLKLEDKSRLTILSNLYKMKTHFLQGKNTSVICKEKDCAFDNYNDPRTEYFYYGQVNEDQGIVRVPASVFFALNEQERLLEIAKRDSVWIISKTGSGKQTKYAVARGKEVEDVTVPIEKANEKLTLAMDSYVRRLESKYDELEKDQEPDPSVEPKSDEEPPFDEPGQGEEVNPDDIPL